MSDEILNKSRKRQRKKIIANEERNKSLDQISNKSRKGSNKSVDEILNKSRKRQRKVPNKKVSFIKSQQFLTSWLTKGIETPGEEKTQPRMIVKESSDKVACTCLPCDISEKCNESNTVEKYVEPASDLYPNCRLSKTSSTRMDSTQNREEAAANSPPNSL